MIRDIRIWWNMKKLQDTKERRRAAAARALGRLGDTRAVEPLIRALGDDSDEVRGDAVGALGQLGDARAVEPLIQALGDREHCLRKFAAEKLARLGEPKWQESVRGDLEDYRRLGSSQDPRAGDWQ